MPTTPVVPIYLGSQSLFRRLGTDEWYIVYADADDQVYYAESIGSTLDMNFWTLGIPRPRPAAGAL